MFDIFQRLRHFILSTNKYLLVTFAFAIWMLFFDANKVTTHLALNRKVKELEREVADYKAKIVQAKKDAIDLEVNKEKYAREKYYMHQPGEDVYIMDSKKQ